MRQGFFKATNFHRCYVQLFNLFSRRNNDHADSDSLLSTSLVQLVNQNQILNFPKDPQRNETDAEQLKKEVINVFTQTEFDTPSGIKVSPKDDSSTHLWII